MEIKLKEVQDMIASVGQCMTVRGLDIDHDNKWAYCLSKNFRILNEEYVKIMKKTNEVPDECKEYVSEYSKMISGFANANPDTNGLKNISPQLKADIDMSIKELNAKYEDQVAKLNNHNEYINKVYLEEVVDIEFHKIAKNLVPVLTPQQYLGIEFLIDETRKALLA